MALSHSVAVVMALLIHNVQCAQEVKTTPRAHSTYKAPYFAREALGQHHIGSPAYLFLVIVYNALLTAPSHLL